MASPERFAGAQTEMEVCACHMPMRVTVYAPPDGAEDRILIIQVANTRVRLHLESPSHVQELATMIAHTCDHATSTQIGEATRG
jgi:hypothetical protein